MWDQACTGTGGREAGYLVKERDVEGYHIIYHGSEPICQARGCDGAVEEEADGNYGFGGEIEFDVDEHRQSHTREREGHEHEWGIPGDDVPA